MSSYDIYVSAAKKTWLSYRFKQEIFFVWH